MASFIPGCVGTNAYTEGETFEATLFPLDLAIEEAIDRAAELADIDAKKSRVVTYEQPTALFDLGLAQNQAFSWDKMLEMSAPKAYYLSSYLPPIVSSFPLGSR